MILSVIVKLFLKNFMKFRRDFFWEHHFYYITEFYQITILWFMEYKNKHVKYSGYAGTCSSRETEDFSRFF